jgi:hypothetical protein
MEEKWTYGDFQIKEGLKPGSKHFQYFFVVSESGEKKCNYCVWIEDAALSRFDQSEDFNRIISSHRADWNNWVKEKIDRGDFRNIVLKLQSSGQEEIDLKEMEEHLTME